MRQNNKSELEKIIEVAKQDLADLLEGKNLRYRKESGNIAAVVPGFSFAYLVAIAPELAPTIRNIGKTVGARILAEFITSTDFRGVLEEIGKIIEAAKLGKPSLLKVGENEAILRVSECADCGGIPDLDRPLCVYDEGIIEGVLETKLKKEASVREKECLDKEGFKHCDFYIKLKG